MNGTEAAFGAATIADVEAAAVRLLSSREHSQAELKRKLIAKGRSADLVDQVLAGLEKRGLLSDERFCAEYVAMRLRKGYGPLRIRSELNERGVAGDLIREVVDEAGHDWPALMREVFHSKFGVAEPDNRKEMARRARFLAQRGFPESLIREMLLD